MGEGWLLTAEMVELIEHYKVNNIVCTQPFGCLPNHICGKGVMRVIKEKNPQANIVAVDYDSSASKVNQQNRIKLMLANARLMAAQEQAKNNNPPKDCGKENTTPSVTVSDISAEEDALPRSGFAASRSKENQSEEPVLQAAAQNG